MKKKVLAMLLAATMVLSMVACGGNDTPATGESKPATGDASTSSDFKMDSIEVIVNGTIPTQDNYRQEFEDQISAATGVDVNFNQQDHSGYADAVGRVFAGGTDFDVILLSSEIYFAYAAAGALYDITELFENSEIQDRLISNCNDALYVDGRLYGFSPTYGNGCVTYIKKAWLDAVGKEVPTTYEEFMDVCDAFVNQDPDGNGVKDTYAMSYPGFMGGKNYEAPYVNYNPEYWQDAYPDIYQKEDGTWVDGFTEQANIDALTRFQEAYKKGYMDPASLTNGTADARNQFYDDKAGIFTYWSGTWKWNLMTNLEANGLEDELIVMAPIEGVPGYIDRTPGGWCINANCTDEEAKFIWENFFEPMVDGGEVMTLWAYGAKGYHWDNIAETVTWGENSATYTEGQFHMLPNAEKPDTLYTKAHIDTTIGVVELTSGPAVGADLGEQDKVVKECNQFFLDNCIPAPLPPLSDTYQGYKGDLSNAKGAVIAEVIVNGMDPVKAIEDLYTKVVGAQVEEILAEING